MKYLLSIILFLFAANLFAQDSSDVLLPPEIMKAEHPSAHTLNDIKIMKSFDSTFMKILIQYDKKNGGTEGFSFDFSSYYNYLRKIILGNDELFLRKYAAMQLPLIKIYGCDTIKKDTILERMCLRILKPDDIIWIISSDNPENPILFFSNIYTNLAVDNYLSHTIKLKSEPNAEETKKNFDIMIKKKFTYNNAIYKKNPNRIVKADALINIIDSYTLFCKFDKADYYYKILKTNYSDIKSDIIKNALIEYSPEGRLRTGKTIPQFDLPLIDSNKKISDEKLKGKYYLSQFWASWCAPCVGEMPKIREIYKKYKKSNFTIVSISLDDSISVLKKFWQKYGDMPWDNVILKNGYNNKIVKYFGIVGVPVIVLVSPEGKILANIITEGENSWSETIGGYLSHQ